MNTIKIKHINEFSDYVNYDKDYDKKIVNEFYIDYGDDYETESLLSIIKEKLNMDKVDIHNIVLNWFGETSADFFLVDDLTDEDKSRLSEHRKRYLGVQKKKELERLERRKVEYLKLKEEFEGKTNE